ncbi:DUF2726 domain-containing protein [Veillonella caviae]|uniref:DUF2726 domain-containing protein n=1 Tax=Veillonella caviae TaxID=248316 RepID=UPI0023526483|nr:DUF2726 domain-containing protein [Veillonella caviae]
MINKLKQWAKTVGLKLLKFSGENYGPILYKKDTPIAKIIPYKYFTPKEILLEDTERSLFLELCNAYENDGYVFPEFCFEKLVESNIEQNRYIFELKKLHADFVIVSKTFELQCVVECDTALHKKQKIKQKDIARDNLLQKWNIPVARIAANGTHTSEELRAIITNAIRKIK